MRKFTQKVSVFMFALTLCVGVMAENTEVKTKAVYTYGAMLDGGYSKLPTGVVRSFYDANNRLSRKLEADIMLADSEGTPQVEVAGQVIPKLYSIYEYDAEGRLLKVRTRKNGVFSVFDRAWADYVDAEVYEYDANGKLVKKTDADYVTTYTWEGENLVEEDVHYAKDNVWSKSIKYTEFAEGKANMPLTALYSDKWSASNSRVYEYAYDEAGNRTLLNEYKVANAETDENGVLVKGDKGNLYMQTTWTYAGDVMTEEIKGYWNSGKGEVDPSTKVSYTVEGDTTTIATYQYFNGQWGKFGGIKKSVSGVVDNATSASEVSVTEVEGRVNTLKITAKAPENATSEGWNVYRNGMLIGEAEYADGVLTYQDEMVTNGTWEYFVQQADANISDIATVTLNTEMPCVGNIACEKNSLNDKGDYECVLVWEKPNTSLEILGYNVYMDIQDYETNPAPENGMELLTEPTFTYTQPVKMNADENGAMSYSDPDHKFYVEVVYAIGKARSDAFDVRLYSEELVLFKKAVLTYGDAMGALDDNMVSKAEVYYYDAAGKLQQIVEMEVKMSDEPCPDSTFKVGEWMTSALTTYDYNDKDQLVGTRRRKYGIYSGFNWAWSEYENIGAFGYDEQGRMTNGSYEANRMHYYKYDGENIVQDTYTNSGSVTIYHKYYSNFVEGLVNCPQYAFANSPYGLTTNDRIYEYTYDEKGNMLTCRAYKYDASTIVKDDEGNVINAEKGTPDYEEIWTYNNNVLVKYEKNVWKQNKNEYVGDSRTEYIPTEQGTRIVSYKYSVGIWAKSGVQREELMIPFEGVAASDLKVTPVEGAVNTLQLTANRPAGSSDTIVWNVFRNGKKIGRMSPGKRNAMEYVDKELPNGTWSYFIQAADPHGETGVNISNLAEGTVFTELPPVTNIQVVKNGYNDVQDYEVILDWEAPATDLEIRGYNMFVDVKTNNPAPVSGLNPFAETEYTYTVGNDANKDKSFIIETVYKIGKAKSEVVAVVLGADGIEGVTVDDMLLMSGNTLFINGEYRSLEIYSASGTLAGHYSGMNSIDLSALEAGVYAIRMNTGNGILTGKVLIKK